MFCSAERAGFLEAEQFSTEGQPFRDMDFREVEQAEFFKLLLRNLPASPSKDPFSKGRGFFFEIRDGCSQLRLQIEIASF